MNMKENSHKLPRSIWALGLVSLFMDTSSETVHGLLPVFLVSVLGASMTSLGLLEGIAESTALIFKVFSGPLSDWIGRRKPLVMIGYTMGALSKPIFALAGSLPWVFGARIFDRIGKGIRGAPRDALVADLAPPALRGRAFGLRQSLDTVGAFLGPMLAIALMWITQNNYREIFWFATIPGLIAVSVLFFGVQEKETEPKDSIHRRIRFSDLKTFPSSFWFVTSAGALFQIARFSEAFLILRAKDFGLTLSLAPVVLIIMNITYAISAYPVGHWSDKIKREWFLFVGLFILCFSDLMLGFAGSLSTVLIGIILWGLHLGLTQGTLVTLVADTCAPSFRGTAYGIFNLFSAVALLIASLMAGILWDQVGPKATFLVGAMVSASALSILLFLFIGPLWNRCLRTKTQPKT